MVTGKIYARLHLKYGLAECRVIFVPLGTKMVNNIAYLSSCHVWFTKN